MQRGDVVHRYTIVSALGAGGMGEVYLAEDSRLGRRVALKVLPALFAGDADRVRRFEQEARAVSALNHPNILTLFDLGQAGDRYFMATEFIDGRTLRAHLKERGRLGAVEAVGIARQCASALSSAHGAGIVHRDIKPENVMQRRDGYVKVLDFGLAKVMERSTPDDVTAEIQPNLTSAGVVLGTVGYLSPEQARGQHVDARTDVFSLGVMLYEMVAGTRPFTGPTPTDVVAAILRAEPAPIDELVPGAPSELHRVLTRALQKDRDQRYGSMGEFSQDLERLAQELSLDKASPERTPATREPSALRPQSSGWRLAVAVLAVLVGTAAVAQWWRTSDRGSSVEPAAGPGLAQVRKLAVLPFQLLGYPAASEHLGLGMADALIVKLTHLRQLTVRPTSAVSRFQAVDQDPGAAGRILQVDAVLMGKVQRAGGRVRVTVQLVPTTSGAESAASIWSDEFTTSADDPFEVQDQLAARLVQKLALEISADERTKLAKTGTTNARARERYMEARFFMNKRTGADYQRALDLFTAASGEDPRYASAHLGQAFAWNALIESGATPLAEGLPKLRAALTTALELDPQLGEAVGLRGFVARIYDWDFAQADRDSRRSMELEPGNSMVLQWRGIHLLAVDGAQEAVLLHRRAVEIDPVDLIGRSQLCRALYFARRYDEALQTAQALLDLDKSQSSAHQWAGLSELELGRADAALSSLQKAVDLAPGFAERTASLAYGYARTGRAGDARRIIAELAGLKGVPRLYHIATIHAGLGDRAATLLWLDRAWQERDGFLANRVRLDPKLDSVRGDARFQDLLKKIGLGR